jgi:hypothetical protein
MMIGRDERAHITGSQAVEEPVEQRGVLQLGDRKVCQWAGRSCLRRDSPGDHVLEGVARERDLSPDAVGRGREQHRRLHDELCVARRDRADGARLAERRRALVEHVPVGDELLELVRTKDDVALAPLCVVGRHISSALDDREREAVWQPVGQREPRIGRDRRHDHIGTRVDLRGDVRSDDIERASAGADSRHPILPRPREHGGLPPVETESLYTRTPTRASHPTPRAWPGDDEADLDLGESSHRRTPSGVRSWTPEHEPRGASAEEFGSPARNLRFDTRGDRNRVHD